MIWLCDKILFFLPWKATAQYVKSDSTSSILTLLLGLCLRKEPNWLSAFVNLAKIGLVVIATFGLIWWPFFPQIEQVLTRIFPLNRGLFEDKVANFWCALNVLFKIKTLYTSDFLALTSAVTTLTLVISVVDFQARG